MVDPQKCVSVFGNIAETRTLPGVLLLGGLEDSENSGGSGQKGGLQGIRTLDEAMSYNTFSAILEKTDVTNYIHIYI